MHTFAQESTIHGIKEVYDARGLWKALWLLLSLAAAACMLFIISMLTYDFFQEPTFDNTELKTPDKFPPVRVWPRLFVDQELASQYGISDPYMRRYLATLLPRPVAETVMDPSQFGGHLDDAIANLSAILGPSTPEPIYDLISNVSAPFESVIQFPPRMSAFFNVTGIHTRPSGIGQSYVFDTQLRMTQLTAESLVLKFYILRDPASLERLIPDDSSRTSDYISFGGLVYSDMDSSATPLRHDHDYDIELRYELYTIINLRRRPCMDYSHGEHWTCMFHCYNREICQPDAGCIFYHTRARHPDYISSVQAPVCSWLQPNHCFYYSNSRADKQTLCAKECPIPCRLEKFIVTATASADSVEPTKSEVAVHFVNPSQFKIVNEEYVYSGVALFSNYGGTISLFFGASVMSVVQAVYYLIFKPRKNN